MKHRYLFALILALGMYQPAFAGKDDHQEDGHNHSEQEPEGHAHGDEEKGGDSHGHDDHADDDHADEGRTTINQPAADAAGIRISKVGPAAIHDTIALTGRIILNRNTTADVRARFPGMVQQVQVNWGDKVSKGQALATIEANESLRSYTLTAPTSGVVLTRNTHIGDVTGDNPLFTIADLSNVWAEFHVFPKDLSKVQEGQQVGIQTLDSKQQVDAPVSLILPTADPLSQTVIAIVAIPNPDNAWRPGMTVEGQVQIATSDVALAVTESALQRMEDRMVVFVKEGDSYDMRPVTTGRNDGRYVEIISGLEAGEDYVSEGSFIVKADIGKAAAAHEH